MTSSSLTLLKILLVRHTTVKRVQCSAHASKIRVTTSLEHATLGVTLPPVQFTLVPHICILQPRAHSVPRHKDSHDQQIEKHHNMLSADFFMSYRAFLVPCARLPPCFPDHAAAAARDNKQTTLYSTSSDFPSRRSRQGLLTARLLSGKYDATRHAHQRSPQEPQHHCPLSVSR